MGETTGPSDALRAALAEAEAGVESLDLRRLLRDHWAWVLGSDPLEATRLGVHDYDDRLPDNSAAGVERERRERRAFLQRAEALAAARLSEADAITVELLSAELRGAVEAEACDFHLWTVSARGNPVTEHNDLPEVHKLETAQGGRNLLGRYRAIAGHIERERANLRTGAARGLFATRESTARVIAMVDKQLAEPLESWPLMAPAGKRPPKWDDRVLSFDDFARELTRVVRDSVKPALAAYGQTLKQVVLPRARDDEHSGVGALPIGEACYAARLRSYTTLPLDSRTVHETGVKEIAKTDAELVALAVKALGVPEGEGAIGAALDKLRGDKSLYFSTEDEVETAAQQALDLAKARMGGFFGVLPKADCVMRRIPAYEAPYTTIAYYKPPHADGSKPGEYFINTFEPATRPRFEARVLAIHESIPGHHLQIAISQELSAVPAFRKHGGFTAFVEGWGLYTERLGLEMGLYRDDLDRIGMVSFDAWRAGRLVVDTGIHALGWSRQKARDYLEQHTALSKQNIDNEVDRYINWPGQALAYKTGQLELWALRREAEAKLGERFAVKGFHDVVLGRGAVTLPVLRRRVRAWIAASR